MSFINLLASDVWSESDIKARLHAEIRSEVSEVAEAELNRALQGMALKMHVLTPAEQQSLMRFKAATDRVALLGIEARADMNLLTAALACERAQARLMVVEPIEPDEEDALARKAAQAVLDAASPDVLELMALRTPPVATA